jgi:hypothetical protein
MTPREFWNILKISDQQQESFEEKISFLNENQKKLINNSINKKIVEYESTFGKSKDAELEDEKIDFSKSHIWYISELIKNFNENNVNYNNQLEKLGLQLQAGNDKLMQTKLSTMILKNKIVCPHCQNAGGVHIKKNTEITKTRVNSTLGRLIGLGTNTERDVIEFLCTFCDMEWKN